MSKRKRFSLNLNQYRNAHFHVLNKAKTVFGSLVEDDVKKLPIFGKIKLTYTIFPPTKRELDVANICSIVDKFFSDVIVSHKKIADDNFKYLPETSYRFGEIDRTNPRCEVLIEPADPNEDPMKINMQVTLDARDIQAAIAAYVAAETGREVDPDSVDIPGATTATATVGDAAEPAKKASKPKASKPKAVKEAPAEEVTEEAEPEVGGPVEPEVVQTTVASPAAEEKAEEPAPAETQDEQPAPKPVSIFNFDKKKA